jgi:hypothetical protein
MRARRSIGRDKSDYSMGVNRLIRQKNSANNGHSPVDLHDEPGASTADIGPFYTRSIPRAVAVV